MKEVIAIGLFAHVDAGKTTLSEALLWKSGSIKKMGRVDHGDSLLDSNPIERSRGITVYSKSCEFELNSKKFVLVDTPGHSDLLAEAERTMPILDGAILILNASDELDSHSKILWKLLRNAKIPTIVFVNKMDLTIENQDSIEKNIKEKLSDKIVNFNGDKKNFFENLAMADNKLMELLLDNDEITEEELKIACLENRVFPLLFGSALKGVGVEKLLRVIDEYVEYRKRDEKLAAIVYKIGHDENGLNLNYIRNFSSSIKVKDELAGEKIQEIRKYQGNKYINVNKLNNGDVAVIVGPDNFCSVDFIGIKKEFISTVKSLFSFCVERIDGGDLFFLEKALYKLEEEFGEIELIGTKHASVPIIKAPGKMALEIYENRLRDFGVEVKFTKAPIDYAETIKGRAIGLGHFEPIGHYAEVQLLIEESEKNVKAKQIVDKTNYRASEGKMKAVIDALSETIPGVLTGSKLENVKISIVDIRESKHSQIEDFIQASRRAIRQGQMQLESILLEPQINFYLSLPPKLIGSIIQEFELLGIDDYEETYKGDKAIIIGKGPISILQDYFLELPSITRGNFDISIEEAGYAQVKDSQSIVDRISYDPYKDMNYPISSIFFKKGAGFSVPWDRVFEFAHSQIRRDLIYGENGNKENIDSIEFNNHRNLKNFKEKTYSISNDEIDKIFRETFYANSNPDKRKMKRQENKVKSKKIEAEKIDYSGKSPLSKKGGEKISERPWLLIDGYNVMNSIPALQEGIEQDLGIIRSAFVDMLSEYRALIDKEIILVFDAYKVHGGTRRIEKRSGISIVYTKEAETADQYIAEVARKKAKDHEIIVVSSDGPVQLISWKEGALVISSRELIEDMIKRKQKTVNEYRKQAPDPLTRRLGQERSLDEFK